MTPPAASAPELSVCEALRPIITWDRNAVVAAVELDHRLPLAGSDEVLRWFGDLQQTLTQGPGVDVLATGLPLVIDDLRTPVDRWPLLQSSLPVGFPVRSLAVVPLSRARVARVGASRPQASWSEVAPPAALTSRGTGTSGPAITGLLVVARDTVTPFTTAQVRLLESLAGLVGGLVEHRGATGQLFDAATTAHLDAEGAVGDELWVVVGMLQAHMEADASQATAWLRARAFATGITMHQIARAVPAGRVSLDEITRPP
jgi:GAF domain-containing protein